MIEAVNSVLANASLSSANAVKASQPAPVEAAEPAVLPSAPFISPRVSYDSNANKAVLQIRDASTGDVINQFPSESRLRAIQAQEAQEASQAARQERLTGSSQSQSSAPVPSFDAGSLATLQAGQGVSTSDVQQAVVAFNAGTSAAAPQSTASVSVTA